MDTKVIQISVQEKPVPLPESKVDKGSYLSFQVGSELTKHHKAFEDEKKERSAQLEAVQAKLLKPEKKAYTSDLQERMIKQPKPESALRIGVEGMSLTHGVDLPSEYDDIKARYYKILIKVNEK